MNPRSRPLLAAAAMFAASLCAAQGESAPFEFSWSRNEIRISSLGGHTGWVRALAPSPDGRRLASASDDGTIRVWDLESGRTLLVLKPGSRAKDAVFSRDGRALLAGSADGSATLWDAQTGKQVWTSPAASEDALAPGVRAVAFSANGAEALAARQNEVDVRDAATGRVLRSIAMNGPYESTYEWVARLSPDGRFAAAAAESGKVAVFDVATGKQVGSWEPGSWKNSVRGLAFLPDGKRLVLGFFDGTVTVWDFATGKKLGRVAKSSKYAFLSGVSVSPDGRLVFVEDESKAVRDLESGDALAGYDGQVTAERFLPDGRRLAVAEYGKFSGDIKVWDFKERRTETTLKAAKVTSVEVSTNADGGYVLGGDGIDSSVIDSFWTGFQSCRAGSERGFDMVSSCLKAVRLSQATPPPTAPVLTQGAYESRAAFDERVAKAKSDFEEALRAHDEKERSFRLPDAEFPISFLMVFGAPKVTKTAYDPDTRIFKVDVAPTGAFAGDFLFHLALRDPVPNEEAEVFETRLATAEPRVSFRVDGRRFSLSSVALQVGDKDYAALPSDASLARELARVDVGAGAPAAAALRVPEGGFAYTESPELAAAQKALEKARREQADAEKLRGLEEEIARIKGAPAKTYSSDVDEPAGASPEDPAAFAVVVGVEGYQNRDVPRADFAERDARAVAKRLESLGVPPRNMRLLVGDGATRARLAGELEDWLPRHAKTGAKVYFYFSGHGAPETGSGDAYLVPWDGDPSLLKSTGFPLRQLYADLDKLPASRRVAVLDACFSGAGGRSVLAKGARPLMLVREPGTGSVTVLAAASASQITGTLDSQGHGLFTYYFLKALAGGKRTASAVYAELKPRVEDEAGRANREQVPVLSGPDAAIP